jgi:hypothetical protein
MSHVLSRSIAVATAAATLLGTIAVTPAAAAPQKAQATNGALTDVSSRARGHRRGYSNGNAAALGAVGLVFGTIAGLAAADQRRRAYESYGYAPYGYAPYGYAPYGYAAPPVYYGGPYGYRRW